MSASRARSPRASITAMPWSASVPDMITRSPGRTRPGPSWRPSGMIPTPAVVMYRPSAAPPLTTLVSPVTIRTPARRAASAMSSTTSRRTSMAKPSSSTKAADSHCGRPAIMATSLTVPLTARSPMEPPGKLVGLTTKESVLKARRSPEGSASAAPSGRTVGTSSLNASRNTASTSAAEALPPAPWARVTTSSLNRGRRRRNASMRSSTADSRRSTAGSLTASPRGRAALASRDRAPSRLAPPGCGARSPTAPPGSGRHVGWWRTDRRRRRPRRW